MMYTGEKETPEKYKDYRHRTMNKFSDRMKNLLISVKECSLKGDDKIKLLKQFKEMIEEKLK